MNIMSSRSCSLRTKFEKEKGINQDLADTETCICNITTTQHEQTPETLDTRQEIVHAIRQILGSTHERKSFKYLRRQSNRFKRPKLSEVTILFIRFSLF